MTNKQEQVVKVSMLCANYEPMQKYLIRLTKNTYNDDAPIIGLDFGQIIVEPGVKLKIYTLSTAVYRIPKICLNSNLLIFCINLSEKQNRQFNHCKILIEDSKRIDLRARVMFVGLLQDQTGELAFKNEVSSREFAEECSRLRYRHCTVCSKTGSGVANSLKMALQLTKLRKLDFQLPPAPADLTPTTSARPIKFFGPDAELLKSCFHEFGGRFLQKVADQVVEFVDGDEVFAGAPESLGAQKAKAVLVVDAETYYRKLAGDRVPVFFIHQAQDASGVLERILELGL